MYYHIMIEISEKAENSKSNRIIIEKDRFDKNEIIDEIVRPYQKGEEFAVAGVTLSKKNIVRLKISESEISSDEIINDIYENLPPLALTIVQEKDIFVRSRTTDITTQIFNDLKESAGETYIYCPHCGKKISIK